MPDTRLIEKWFPVNEISVESIRERAGAIPNPEPHQLHVWWARRPLASSRAAVAAALLPEDYSHDSFTTAMGTYSGVHHDQKRMADAREEGKNEKLGYRNRRAFRHNPTADQQSEFLNAAHGATGTDSPVVLDITAGGGSIPFEAGRLGLQTIANELNPVAAFILRATCEWPQRYGYPLVDAYSEVSGKFLNEVNRRLADVYPEENQPDCRSGNCPHPQRWNCDQGCADGLSCPHISEEARSHAAVRAQRKTQTYLWARTVSCPNCARVIPLSPNWRLDNKGTGIRLAAGIEATECEFQVVHDRKACEHCKGPDRQCHTATLHPDGQVSPGTVTRAIATCPWLDCGRTTPKGYLSEEAQAGRMGHQLYCIVYRDSWIEKTKDGIDKRRPTTFRGFAQVTPDQTDMELIEAELSRLDPQWTLEDLLPSEQIPDGNKTKDAIHYGMNKWKEMFNPRQQLVHGHCVEAFRYLVDLERNEGQLDELRQAAWGYVAIGMDKLIGTNSLFCRWHANRGVVAGTFDSHDFGFKWSYAEMVVGGPYGYGLEWAQEDLEECIEALVNMAGWNKPNNGGTMLDEANPRSNITPPTQVIIGRAQYTGLPDQSVDAIVLDPPYHDNVNYAELSDFFYVWLKRTAGYIFQEHFDDYLVDKVNEAIASPARFKDRATKDNSAHKQATNDYHAKMQEIFTECNRLIKNDGIMVVMFTHKRTDAWNALTLALMNAGFNITRTWPVKTEAESSIHIKDKAAARSTTLLVCRPKPEGEAHKPKDWATVQQLIAQAVKDDLENLAEYDLAPLDTQLASYGTALKIVSENWGAQRGTANPNRPLDPFSVTAEDALAVAGLQVMQRRARETSPDGYQGIEDGVSKFYLGLENFFPGNVVPFDEARLFAQFADVELDSRLMQRYLRKTGDKVFILSARERMAQRKIGRGITPENALDEVHTAIAIADNEDTAEAKQYLQLSMVDTERIEFRSTLLFLVNSLRPGHNDYTPARNLWQALYGTPPPENARLVLGQETSSHASS